MEFGVKKIEKIVESFINDETMNIGEFVLGLEKPLQELQREIIAETIEGIDQVFRNSIFRTDKYDIERSNDSNSFMSTCGEIKYSRTYFVSKETGGYKYLADQACGITKNMRKSEDVVIEALNHVVDSSYRISGEHAVKTDDIISKQAIMKDLHSLEIPALIPFVKKKKQVKILYINADEDHVSLQFNNKKGDLKVGLNGYKSNTIEPRLACIFESIEAESPTSKRKSLIGKHYFAGVYKKSEDIWDEVLNYIEAVYDETYIERIYIMGDGAPWIKKGLEVLGAKSCFVLDKFHLNQAIMRAIGHLEDSVGDARDTIYDGISFEDKKAIKNVFKTATEFAKSEGKCEQIRRSKVYIENHWEAIIRPNEDEHARVGCSAEGQVSHLLSARLSSRPLGWSKKGVDKISRLRAYVANGGEVCDLLKYKQEKQERIVQEEIRREIKEEIKKKQKTYTDVWSHQTVAASIGLVDGMYCMTKKLRGII